MIPRRFKTLRARFALWVAGLLLAVLLVFGVLVYVGLASSLASAVDDSLQLSAAQAIAAVNVENGQISFADSMPEPSDLQGRGLTIRILDATGRIRQATGTYRDLLIDPPSLTAALAGQASFTTLTDPQSHDPIRFRSVPMIENDRVIAIVQVAQSLDTVVDTLDRLLAALLLSVPVLVALAALGGYLLATRALHPIDVITRTARRISAEDLHARLNLPPSDDEVGRLALTFDEMLARLDDSFKRERRFTADASHELRTPLAAMQAILGVIQAQRRTPDDYERALADLTIQADRLRALVEDLLRLARSDARPAEPHESVDLAILVSDVIETLRPLAEDNGLIIECDLIADLSINGDRDDLIRLLLNVLDNAIKYTDHGCVTVSMIQASDTIELSVNDTGRGIDPAHLPHIFERFYRVDTARGVGGSGLGLAIAEEIVRAHGGTIVIESTLGHGTHCRICFPTRADVLHQ